MRRNLKKSCTINEPIIDTASVHFHIVQLQKVRFAALTGIRGKYAGLLSIHCTVVVHGTLKGNARLFSIHYSDVVTETWAGHSRFLSIRCTNVVSWTSTENAQLLR